jgi:hypothetical protein
VMEDAYRLAGDAPALTRVRLPPVAPPQITGF